MNDLAVLDVLGQGIYGTVYKVNCNGKIYALKQQVSDDDDLFIEALREVDILSRIYHPNIIKLHNVYICDRTWIMIMDYIPFTLNQLLQSHQLSDFDISNYSWQLLHAIYACEHRGIIHRDIKPSNILIDPDTKRLYLADFGLSRLTNKFMSNEVCTLLYRPPELFTDPVSYSSKIDIWSCACVLYELSTGQILFDSADDVSIKNLHLSITTRPLIPSNPLLDDLLHKMLLLNPIDRITAKQALNHPYFSNFYYRTIFTFSPPSSDINLNLPFPTDWLSQINSYFNYKDLTLQLTLSLLSRYLSHIYCSPYHSLLLGISCLALAAALEEFKIQPIENYSNVINNSYSTDQIKDCIYHIMSTLNYRLYVL